MNEEKKASNFELNYIKIGINVFHLHKGDKFTSNGSNFKYEPSTAENKGKGRRYDTYSGRSSSVSAMKYKKDVMRADNIELVEDRLMHIDSQGKEHRYKVWEVKYAYKIELDKPENLLSMVIRQDRYDNNNWKFETSEMAVQRETKETFFLEKSHPVTYHSQIPKSTLDIVHTHYSDHYIIGKIDDYAVLEQKLFTYMENLTKERIVSAEEILQKRKDEYHQFLLFKSKNGY